MAIYSYDCDVEIFVLICGGYAATIYWFWLRREDLFIFGWVEAMIYLFDCDEKISIYLFGCGEKIYLFAVDLQWRYLFMILKEPILFLILRSRHLVAKAIRIWVDAMMMIYMWFIYDFCLRPDWLGFGCLALIGFPKWGCVVLVRDYSLGRFKVVAWCPVSWCFAMWNVSPARC